MYHFEVNGFILVKCRNCEKKKWLLKNQYCELENKYIYLFCENMCAISYELKNPHIKIKKNYSENSFHNIQINTRKVGSI